MRKAKLLHASSLLLFVFLVSNCGAAGKTWILWHLQTGNFLQRDPTTGEIHFNSLLHISALLATQLGYEVSKGSRRESNSTQGFYYVPLLLVVIVMFVVATSCCRSWLRLFHATHRGTHTNTRAYTFTCIHNTLPHTNLRTHMPWQISSKRSLTHCSGAFLKTILYQLQHYRQIPDRLSLN